MSDTDEQELIDSIESGEWTSVKDFNAIKSQLMKAATETALKDHRINVRVSKRDAEALKTRHWKKEFHTRHSLQVFYINLS